MIEQQVTNMRRNAQLGHLGLDCVADGVKEEIVDPGCRPDFGCQLGTGIEIGVSLMAPGKTNPFTGSFGSSSSFGFKPNRMCCASRGKGAACVRLFRRPSFGVHSEAALISSHRIPASAVFRLPVRINSLRKGPVRPPIWSAAFHKAFSSSSLKYRLRGFSPSHGRSMPTIGDVVSFLMPGLVHQQKKVDK